MRTDIGRSETRTISIDAPPGEVLAFLAEARNLPRWAPAFARTVRPDGDAWIINEAESPARVAVRAAPDQGTVDLVAAADHRIGAFTRVLPNGGGSEYVFTLFFPAGTEEAAIARQMATVDEELTSVRAHCEPVPR